MLQQLLPQLSSIFLLHTDFPVPKLDGKVVSQHEQVDQELHLDPFST